MLLSGDAGKSGRGDLNEMRLMFVLLGGDIYFTLALSVLNTNIWILHNSMLLPNNNISK